jgi:hypothetical protein
MDPAAFSVSVVVDSPQVQIDFSNAIHILSDDGIARLFSNYSPMHCVHVQFSIYIPFSFCC